MAFYLTRYQNDSRAQDQEPGGVFTLGSSYCPHRPFSEFLIIVSMTGTTNASLYTGQIDHQNVPSGAVLYWTLPITSLSVNSNSVSLPSGMSLYAAIDTGMTLIGGPATQVASLCASIPNSTLGTGNYKGYYTYRASPTCLPS